MAADRDRIIGVLCAIWEDLLAVEVTPDDDFFELGGYSLLLVNVVADARTQGVELTPAHVFEHKTPAAIAAALLPGGGSAHDDPAAATGAAPAAVAGAEAAAGAAQARDPEFAAVWATGLRPQQAVPQSTLTPLTPGGTGTPLFCFHWGAGNVRFVSELVDTFRGDRPVFGVESIGLWNRELPPLSVVEMATRYLADIREEQPHGPYLLLGLCVGGRLAYEVARQLEQAGETTAVLAIANAMPPGNGDLDPSWGLREIYEFRLASLRSQFDVPYLDADRERVLRAMTETAKIDGTMPAEDLFWRQAVWAAGNFAQEHYQPRPYGGEATVFQLQQQAGNPDARWSRIVPALEVHTIDAADTLPLLRHPAFAEALRKKLAAYSR